MESLFYWSVKGRGDELRVHGFEASLLHTVLYIVHMLLLDIKEDGVNIKATTKAQQGNSEFANLCVTFWYALY